MSQVVPLEDACDTALFGSKATSLGQAIREGLPVPPGFALSGPIVEAVAANDSKAIDEVIARVTPLKGPLAVRSSAVDEDGADTSFAGQHLTLLNVTSAAELATALNEIWWSANSDAAISYRKRVGLLNRPVVGVVVQALLDPVAAGVLFTRNPITGDDERMVEASWGLGEAVVNGVVIPDHYRLDRSGQALERRPGLKRVAIRNDPGGGTVEEEVSPELAESLCLDDGNLAELNALAARCEDVYGPARDIEWALADGKIYLLQCRAITGSATEEPTETRGAPVGAIRQVSLFADLDEDEAGQIASLFKSRRFPAGATAVQEGSGGAALYLIESGEAKVYVAGEEKNTLGPGDYFGEIALIDEGTRMATIVASTDLDCYGLTYWDFRPLVEANGVIGWKLLQRMVTLLRQGREE